MRRNRSHNPTVPRTDLDTSLGVKIACKLAKSLTEISSKVHKPKTYNEAIDNSIYGNRWREIIDKKLWKLDLHQAWYYEELPSKRKVIGYK